MSAQGGRAWVFGNDISTDSLAPGPYLRHPLDELAMQCLKSVDPAFAVDVKPGDFVVGGNNFGIGSSREQAAQSLHHLGVSAVIAQSFAGIFFRNAFNFGLLCLICPDTSQIKAGHRLAIDQQAGDISNLTTGVVITSEAVPTHLMDLVRDGGLIPHLEKRFSASAPGS